VTALARAVPSTCEVEWAAARGAFASPVFDALRRQLESLNGFPDVDALNELAARESLLLAANGEPLVFAAPRAAARGLQSVDNRYEARVHREAVIETRPGNWHDVFNALAWMAWPLAKAALNAVHVRDMQNAGAVGRVQRSVARDLATLFDEGGAVLACAEPALAGLLREFRWRELFCTRRAEVLSRMRCYIFGHALFDRARQPCKGMTAHTLIFPVTPAFFHQAPALQVAALDSMIAGWFGDAANLDSTRRLAPLPVFGFPEFCADNAEPHYYDDAKVFRPGRVRTTR
jgi:hypothetical protein